MILPLALLAAACGTRTQVTKQSDDNRWSDYPVGEIRFINASPETRGAAIYASIIPDPRAYIARHARQVLETLYFSPTDSIPGIREIRYTLRDYDGISAKGGGVPSVHIEYSTRWVERSFGENADTAKLEYETSGVLFHELTHAFQLEPKGIGTYSTNKTFWAFIEGMADAVRVINNRFQESDCPAGGNYADGYRTTGFFLAWIARTKDANFLRSFNRSALEVVPWSFDGAIKHILGDQYSVDDLWQEYQRSRAAKE
ncbi:MAG: basic secretory family protein [Odoribacteraceae bacterium]|nr:basic secretory family protein [Odoribacteraceae bacterium]